MLGPATVALIAPSILQGIFIFSPSVITLHYFLHYRFYMCVLFSAIFLNKNVPERIE